METIKAVQDYDLMFITDATASMGRFLTDLTSALPQIFDLVQLTNLIDRISVLAFRDYCDTELIAWSGWSSIMDTSGLLSFVEQLLPDGGGDEPEAVKTGLWEASKKVEKPTICILYVDAPPHHNYANRPESDNCRMEVSALGKTNSQWITICELLHDRQMRMYPVFPTLHDPETYPFYVSLAEFTNGHCVEIGSSSVTRATIGILLNLAGVEFEYAQKCSNITKHQDWNYKEILADRSMYKKNKREKPHRGPVKIEVIQAIKLKIGSPTINFQKSEEYKDVVFRVFHRLLLPERVMAFTYNTLFGKLWREICKQRKDPRRDALVERLGQTVTMISDSDRTALQAFIDTTYDNTDEIERLILPYGVDGLFYVIDHDKHLSRKTLFEIGLSCAPVAVQTVLQLLTGLRVTAQMPSRQCNVPYLPVNLQSNLKFKLLPHLMCPGTMFSLRLSAIMAAIAKISRSILRDDATRFLNEIRGTWIDLQLPECNSIDFARLMMQIKADGLTEDEARHFRNMIMIGSVKRSRKNQLEVEISYTSYKTKRPDYKDKCKTCGQWRSVTLLLDDTCALCLLNDGVSYLEPKSETDSWMCECRKCLVHYAVYAKDDLRCRAKCHFCRLGKVAPSVTCQLCKSKFLYQRSLPLSDYTCAVCAQNNIRVGQKCNLTVEKYVRQNGARFIGMDIDPVTFFDDKTRVFKMSIEEKQKVMRNFENIDEKELMNHSFMVGESRKEVWNVKEIQQTLISLLMKLKASQCMICFEEVPSDKLLPICGLTKKGCSIEACRKCLNSWYNQLAPGRVCQPAQLVCCYCKRIPALKIVKQYNRALCTLMNTMDVTAFDPAYIYAWCLKCFAIKQAMPRECGREQQEIVDFQCVDCVDTHHTLAKECPKCKVLTEKYGGCNHITCQNVLTDGTVCNAHWCWVCGVLSTDSEIYAHLSTVHGGFFSPEDIEGCDGEIYIDE
ncbi:uncharacterized protein LOC119081690 [Bradysia coprophila]|uniref:uncharacterized protein LOC119081690 n=1 Tax=Bradysia coprophila TaxID=38358 RepID=UPI00187DA9DD|nr:uncharacterized protein LOC119081690 [Bradysia coprophila]